MSAVTETSADQLAKLALGAATQLDKIQRNRTSDVSAIHKFADTVANLSWIDGNMSTGRLALDPASSEMFSEAVSRATERRIEDISTLSQELAEFVNKMRQSPPNEEIAETTLPDLKAFCLYVHDFLLKNKGIIPLRRV